MIPCAGGIQQKTQGTNTNKTHPHNTKNTPTNTTTQPHIARLIHCLHQSRELIPRQLHLSENVMCVTRGAMYWAAAGLVATILGLWAFLTWFLLPPNDLLSLVRQVLFLAAFLFVIGIGAWEYLWKGK
jgi:hypothetical protein